ncbi:hypothetical protein C0J52_23296 [Blattella germanica]|nr:hypothetical protein C0J52_23296 [Blattella germanica]
MTPLDFFLWGFVKDQVYVPPFPAKLTEVRDRIIEAVVAVTADRLIKVWDELAYRLDVCRVINGAHIDHLRTKTVFLPLSFDPTHNYLRLFLMIL